ncbi:M1 family metallopeptidase [Nostocoides vanveenii]|uniref:Aminopeptidase N n=1 Tax=Nostocoides vanveenii TaxID=330835 RepID=A0ABN2KWA7_9MICO
MTTSTRRRRARRAATTGIAAAAATALAAPLAFAAPGPGAGGIGDPYYPAYGNGGYDVSNYNLFVDYVPTTGRITGTAIITAKATQDLSSFNLDLMLTAKTVTVNGKPAEFAKPDPHELVVKPSLPIKNGATIVVKVTYTGIPSKISYGGINPWIGSGSEAIALGEPEIAAWWFPSNDHPRDKATFDMKFTVPKGLEAIGAGDFVGKTSGTTTDTWTWKSPQPTATYLVYMAVGQFDVLTGTQNARPFTSAITTTRNDAAVTRAKTDVLRTPEVINWEAAQFGPYAFKQVGGVIANQSFGFALETQQRPVYTPDFWGNGSNIYVIVHENAHQWFGDSVSVYNWRDIWLNEGFATYAEFLWSDKHGEGTTNQLLEQYYTGLAGDPDFWKLPISNPGAHNEFSWAVYMRGGMTLAALRNLVGDATMTKILQAWTSSKKGKNGSIAEFTSLAKRVSGRDLDTFFKNWLTVRTAPAHTAANGFLATRETGTARSADTILQNAKRQAAIQHGHK